MTTIGIVVIIEAGIGLERDHSQESARTNRDRIRCYNCREYDHFVRVCPTSREGRDLDQLQQMLQFGRRRKTHLLNSTQSNPIENSRTSPLNL